LSQSREVTCSPRPAGCPSAWHRREPRNESPGNLWIVRLQADEVLAEYPAQVPQAGATRPGAQDPSATPARGEARPLLAVGRDQDRHGRLQVVLGLAGWVVPAHPGGGHVHDPGRGSDVERRRRPSRAPRRESAVRTEPWTAFEVVEACVTPQEPRWPTCSRGREPQPGSNAAPTRVQTNHQSILDTHSLQEVES
jgi:hypothetical protein